MRRTINLEDPGLARDLLGVEDCHLRRIREALNVNVFLRKDQLHVDGEEGDVGKGAQIFEEMLKIVREGRPLGKIEVDRILDSVSGKASGRERPINNGWSKDDPDGQKTYKNNVANRLPLIGVGDDGDGPFAGRVRALTPGQEKYVASIRQNDLVFAIGPAGSGKTYLAVTMALDYLLRNQVNRLILVRPAVEAGEHLGFLPGDLSEKVNPYLRPLYDSIHDLITPQQTARFMERGVIEVAPLAFMRGRTLNNAFVILDEAQNTTPKQMKMFLTRLGRDARAVITGDVTQVDLPDSHQSGLAHAVDVLNGVEGVGFVYLRRQDIVRHPLVQRIVNAYEVREGTTEEVDSGGRTE